MKLLCESCERLAAPASWRVQGDALLLTCGGCGTVAELRSRPTPTVTSPALPAVPRRTTSAVAATTPGPDWLQRGWNDLTARWTDPAAHERLLSEAVMRNGLAELGRRYREVLEARPDDEPARTARESLLRRASAELLTSQPRAERGLSVESARRMRGVLLAVAAVAVVALAAWAFLAAGHILPGAP